MYAARIARFRHWAEQQNPPVSLGLESVQQWLRQLSTEGSSASALNQSLTALKSLAADATASAELSYGTLVSIQALSARDFAGERPTGPISIGANKKPLPPPAPSPALPPPAPSPALPPPAPSPALPPPATSPAPDNPDHPDSLTVVYHQPGDRGPRHARFPEINVSATGRLHGMSKSQLSRLLNGENRPGMDSLRTLSAILRLPVEQVMEMYKDSGSKPRPKPKRNVDAAQQDP
jgi:hypothetical protein